MHISAFQPYAGAKHQRPACARSSPQIHAVARRHPTARQGPQAPSATPQNATELSSSTADASLASSRAASSPHQLPDAVKASVLENTLHVTSSQQQHSASTAPSAPPTNMLDGAAGSTLIPAGDGPWGRTSAPPPLTSVLPMWRLPRSGDDTNALRPLPGYYSDAASPVDYAETERALLVLLACPDLDTALTPPHTTTQAGQVMAASAAPLDPSMQLFTMPSFPAHLPTASASSAADSKASMDVSSPADIHGNMSQLPAYAYTPAGRLLDHGQLQAVSSQQQAVVAAAALVARAVSSALVIAYPTQPPSAEAQEADAAAAHAYPTDCSPVDSARTFLHRTLYRINRLNFFWFDPLGHYSNEQSLVLARLRKTVESAWQAWEARQPETSPETFRTLSSDQVAETLTAWYERDVDPSLSGAARYMRERMSMEGYTHLLAAGSVDGLAEASRQSRVCAGAGNVVSCMVFKVLMEEYGAGRLAKKHSTFYASMMQQLGLNDALEDYFDVLPWQWLAVTNHNFYLTEQRRHYLRYTGGLAFFETNGPSVYRTYCLVGERLGLDASAWGYWALHVKEDERHGRWMVEDAAIPLAHRYDGGGGWEVAWGWAQERSMGARAGDALVRDIQRMESARGIGTSAPPGTQVNSNDMPAGSGVCFKAG